MGWVSGWSNCFADSSIKYWYKCKDADIFSLYHRAFFIRPKGLVLAFCNSVTAQFSQCLCSPSCFQMFSHCYSVRLRCVSHGTNKSCCCFGGTSLKYHQTYKDQEILIVVQCSPSESVMTSLAVLPLYVYPFLLMPLEVFMYLVFLPFCEKVTRKITVGM